ncbi:MAG: aldehyde dehydrogenase family protein [Candidatus Baltobacteraceae bacterium]
MGYDADLETLRGGARSWASLPLSRKIELLAACRAATGRCAEGWTRAAALAKGTAATPIEGEERLAGPWALISALNHFLRTLAEIERFGSPALDPRRVRVRRSGQTVVDVFPSDGYDRVLLNGLRAEVWMDPELDASDLRETMAVSYRSDAAPRVTLVLGAGNVASIPALDVLYRLVAMRSVCLLKLNPVAEYLGPFLEESLAPLIDGGYLRVAYGDAEAGAYLCAHPLVDEIHVTGSARTHDAIVFGGGAEGAQRKARGEPISHKPISSELGCVSPTIVVPGRWSDADVRFQAEHIATQKLHNDGFDCISLQVLVLPAHWDRTQALLDAVAGVMRTQPDRPAYYPGALERYRRLASGRASLQRFGRDGDGFVPRAILSVDAADTAEPAFSSEAFCPLLAVTTLPGDLETYLREAVSFANERLWGTLGANLLVDPGTMRAHASAIDRAIADLRYGCIGVNAWAGVAFLLSPVPWGAYPGSTPADIGSGTGVVHNTQLFSRSQKSVLYAPFAPFPRGIFSGQTTLMPKPPWFVTHRNQNALARALCRLELSRSLPRRRATARSRSPL